MNTPQIINGQPDWTPFAPPVDLQYSIPTKTDADNCAEEAPVHAIGFASGFWGSPRLISWYVKPSQQTGSSPLDSLFQINKNGLAPYSQYPNPVSFTLAEYFQTPPQSVLAVQVPCIVNFVPANLTKYPSVVRLLFPNGEEHFGVKVNSQNYFDSEPGNPFKTLDYGGAVVTWEFGVQVLSDDFFLKSSGFTPAQFANLSPAIQEAIKANDNGAKNIIINNQIIPQ